MAVRTGKGKADKGTSTSIREGVRLPEQGGGLTPERKSPRTPTLRFRERKTIGCSGESARRPRKGKTSAGPGESIHIPGGRRGSSGQAGGGREQHTCREARIRRRHSRTRQANGKKISRNYLQVLENIVSLHSQYQNGALVQLVRIRACHARGQGFESPTHRQQTEGKIPGGKKRKTRQFTTASFFVSPHRMAVRMGKGEADKGTSASIRVRCRNARASRQPACRAKPDSGMKLSGRLRRIYKRANTIPHEIRFR